MHETRCGINVDSVNRFCSADTHVLCADGQVIYNRYILLITYIDIHIPCQVRLCWGFMDSLCMDCAEVFMACMCSNRCCPCCWCPNSQLVDTQPPCKYRRAKDVFAQLDAVRDQLLDDEDCVLKGRLKL